MYFYSAMADIAREYGDADLFRACARLWEDSTNKKMYVTGGVSAERFGEAIGTDYVLPNDLAYTETCAYVAMANFSMRMFCLEQNGKYADMIERQMYNGALAGLAMDGKAFYYDNALQCRVAVTDFFTNIHARPLYPAYQRQRVFECSCCPPNVYRFIAAMGQYFYSVQESTLFVHQYASSTATLTFGGKELSITQNTCYPWDGNISITLHTASPINGKIAVRIPAWSRSFTLTQNGKAVNASVTNGYVYIDREWNEKDTLRLELPMPVEQLYANPNVVEAAGKVALKRGPVVYCLEGTDNANTNLFNLTLPREESACNFSLAQTNICGHEVTVIHGTALTENLPAWEVSLYRTGAPEFTPAQFTAIPYFACSNRQINDMTVWIKKQV